ncbi:hypothetical protein RIF29_33118 [Crotalaria pallida]|uniref:Alpha-1,4 glucan phosphorylase n=1 Tax=Crotalaria pallida TaxID=3830 RepID=A0AAN9E7R6_CROPI
MKENGAAIFEEKGESMSLKCKYFQYADNEDLQLEWTEAKKRNKVRVASFLKEKTGYVVSPDAMFDVQVRFLS